MRLFFTGLALGITAAATARADEPRPARVRLEWTSLDGCMEAGTLRASTEEALGRPAFADSNEDLVVRGHAGRSSTGGFEATLTLSRVNGEPLGERTFTSTARQCGHLSAGLPLALALMIDLPLREATVRVVLPPTVPEPPPKPVAPRAAPAPPSAPPPAPIAESSRRSGAGAALDVGPIFRVGSFPRAAYGLRVAGETGVLGWPVGVEATWFAPRQVDDGTVTASVWGVSGGLFACPIHRRAGHGFFGACAVVEGGAALADGLRISEARRDFAWLVSAGGRLRAGLPLGGGWTFGLETTASAFVIRPNLAYRTADGGRHVFADSAIGTLDGRLVFGIRLP